MAAYIPDDKIEAIKTTCDIVEIISESVSLRRAGRNYLGLCPFHAEKTPSFTVSPEKQIFYCFGCGAGGNVFSFLMKQDGLTFPEAARTLARRCGIDLPSRKLSPFEKKKLTEREMILTLNGEAMAFYRSCLFSEKGREAMAYLLKRGMARKTIEDFNLGYAPDGWDHLLRQFRSSRKPVQTALAAGLIIPRKKGEGYYDRFRNRIVFPISNAQSQPIGFGGRVMDDALPKYLNSPETPVYNKSRSLYGLDRARTKSRETETIYVVEGYFDRLAMHQFGFENTVATLGTSLTADHVRILKGFVGEGGRAILVYDSDQAGIKAAQRSVAVFQKGLLEARILVLPEGYDPDSFLMAHGPDEFRKAAENAMGMIAFMVESAVEKYGLGIDGKVRIVNDLRVAIRAVADPVARSLQVKHLAERIGVDETVILQKVRQAGGSPARNDRRPSGPPGRASVATPARPARGDGWRLERQVVTMMLQFPEMIADISERGLLDHFTDPLLADIGRGIIEYYNQSGGDVAGLVSRWEDAEKKALIARLALSDEHWDRSGCTNLINQFESSIRRHDKDLVKRIESAEKSGDINLLAELLQKKQHQARKTIQRQSGAVK
ncbi:DNA primase [Desulfosarcina ovata subsp. sediminis]|uniref:DNA primase n=1 Tax=Desulfosarcina ovata subsp. sediminis TaxID=885957 RepID=A0A5K7ZGN4_9BACT|nr:DNA primase [Desulfosarcina ovata]BBO80136.1 DNA primase [Desulfosarcina ovata subsp. sediminis]